MTWSYNPSLLATNSKDAVRLLIGDVLTTDPQMQDEEINYLISARGTLYGAAAECCRALAAKFSRSVDQQAGTSKLMWSHLAKAYTLKANEFETKSILIGAAMPYAGGISLSDKQMQDLNTDRVQPIFTIGIMDSSLPVNAGPNETIEEFGR